VIFRNGSTSRQLPLWLGALAALGLLALFFFDPSRYHFYPVCVFHQTTGLLCPGCGSLRALHQLLHGHVQAALRYNSLLVLSIPTALSIAAVSAIRKSKAPPNPTRTWFWVVCFLVLGLAFGVWRNLPGAHQGVWPFSMKA
jgi:hypothetical protein